MYLYLYPKLDFYNISIKKLVFTSALSCVRAGIWLKANYVYSYA